MRYDKLNMIPLGVFIFLGLTMLGYQLGTAVIKFKEYERTITVKGLVEEEHDADVVIWPIQFTEANNSLENLYSSIEKSTEKIKKFLKKNGINENEISLAIPSIMDKSAQRYGGELGTKFRYTANQAVTIYSKNIKTVRNVMGILSELGKQGIAFTGQDYQYHTEYMFNRLNEVKPKMIEEATRKAREVAEKFASDSKSKLGKIKKALQGQFSIRSRDKNNPHIKKIRVVSTIVYYLSD